MKSTVKKFAVSMPIGAYEHYQAKAKAAGLSISQFLYRSGSLTTVEQAVMFPLNQNNHEGLGAPAK